MLIGSIPNNASSTHSLFVFLLNELYPNHKIFLEYSVKKLLINYWDFNKIEPNFRDNTLLASVNYLTIDIYDFTYPMLFEIQGSQHYKYNSFFHNTYGDFDIQKINDKNKKTVANLVNISLIEISIDTEITKKKIKEYYNNYIKYY